MESEKKVYYGEVIDVRLEQDQIEFLIVDPENTSFKTLWVFNIGFLSFERTNPPKINDIYEIEVVSKQFNYKCFRLMYTFTLTKDFDKI